MICPKCGGNNVISKSISNTTVEGKTKGFGWIKSCLGLLIFNIPGILCGLCGMGKGKHKTSTTTTVVHTCQNCGNQF